MIANIVRWSQALSTRLSTIPTTATTPASSTNTLFCVVGVMGRPKRSWTGRDCLRVRSCSVESGSSLIAADTGHVGPKVIRPTRPLGHDAFSTAGERSTIEVQ